MTSIVQLAGGNLRCAIAPELGGSIAGLWWDGQPVLRSPAPGTLNSARQSGCYALVPFSNRVAHASLKWQGTSHPLVQNNAAEPHAIHGVGWQRPWSVLEEDAQFVMLAYEHRPDADWPFAFDTSQTFRVSGNSLEMTLGITNQSAAQAPVGLGWHPYFLKRADSRISFEATGRWEMGADKLPTHRSPAGGLDADCAALDVDHCFDGWNGVAELRDKALRIRVEANLSRLVVFTNAARDYIAIEPVSHVNNAVNLMEAGAASAEELGVRVLQPGESMSAQMTISIESFK
jgi:aldose 1-epimerase